VAVAKDSVPGISSGRDDARDAFLVELASFDLQLKKSAMVCAAEARQVEEYRRERQRIADDHIKLRGQIEQLKTSLEHAQMLRKRKMEYDQVAEKINALPSRDELDECVMSQVSASQSLMVSKGLSIRLKAIWQQYILNTKPRTK
jgi:THO complex subunit 7